MTDGTYFDLLLCCG